MFQPTIISNRLMHYALSVLIASPRKKTSRGYSYQLNLSRPYICWWTGHIYPTFWSV